MKTVRHAGVTHRGRVRKRNEDNWTADAEFGLFVVSDGMGGEAAGALASRMVVETLPALLHARFGGVGSLTDIESTSCLLNVLAELSDTVRDLTDQEPRLHGMGATVVLALVRDRDALIAHMGDSRAYLLRGMELEQLTRDHSLVQLLLESGDVTSEQAAVHPARGQITRYVGMSGEALPEVRCMPLQAGDRLLLCTDGLTGMLSGAEIQALLGAAPTPARACRELVAAANEAGGADNITAVALIIP